MRFKGFPKPNLIFEYIHETLKVLKLWSKISRALKNFKDLETQLINLIWGVKLSE